MTRRGPKPEKKVQTIWSPELAYAVGLITSDGNLSNDRRHIDFTSKDLELIKTFKHCLGLKRIKIGTKTSGYTSKRYYRIQFGDVNLYNWLLQIGLMPHKSKSLQALKIPDRYFFDFLRGYFDGDGTIYSYWDPRWKSSFMFYLQFASASRLYLQWLQLKLGELSNVHGRIQSGNRSYQLVFAKRESCILFKKMYHQKNSPKLKRKYLKMQKILAIDLKNK
ncbi:MAG: hypothetical protein HYT40_00305 [Candidatus Sungbacteria bacterium]|uniref:DOD-type homing endonuclease domain-containing protein n=1 Tax=Candidatus Sungiibacteriota bacterium TaxID=2750080 RepID=A0A931WNG6_9BACT|nr:hypothetical protein [Candidatus Sungbacteria bacterium]